MTPYRLNVLWEREGSLGCGRTPESDTWPTLGSKDPLGSPASSNQSGPLFPSPLAAAASIRGDGPTGLRDYGAYLPHHCNIIGAWTVNPEMATLERESGAEVEGETGNLLLITQKRTTVLRQPRISCNGPISSGVGKACPPPHASPVSHRCLPPNARRARLFFGGIIHGPD